MRVGCIEISGSALLVAAVLFYLDRDGVIFWLLLACMLHELGHWWAIYLLGGKVQGARLSCVGAELRLSPAHPFSPVRFALAALAGPTVNLLLAAGSSFLARCGVGSRLYLFAGINLGLACFNLLPAGRLDGGRVLTGLLGGMGREDLAEKVVWWCSVLVTFLFFFAGGVLLWESGGRNFTLLLAGLWMLRTAWDGK